MKFKKLLSLGLAFVLSFSFVFFLSLNFVSAYSLVDFSFSDNILLKTESNLTESDLISIYKAFVKNPNLSEFGASSDSLAIQAYKYPNSDQLLLRLTSSDYLFDIGSGLIPSSSDSSYDYISINTSLTESNFSNFSTMHFSLISHSLSDSMYSAPLYYKSLQCFIQVSSFNIVSSVVGSPSYNRYYSFIYNYSSFVPSDPSYNLHFSYPTDDFYDWIINNNKLSELPSYIIQSKLKSFLEFYKSYGSSSTNFFKNIVDWFSFVSIPNQTVDNVSILKGSIDKLYQEYLRYRSSQHAYWPGAHFTEDRNSISTVTDNNNTSLITDDSNDDIITSILRDILRGVIAISNQVYESGNSIIGALDELSFDVVVSNNGGYSGTDINPLLLKMDDIIEALQADTVSVEIDQTTQDDTDQFLSVWADEFSVELDSKFPVINQLGSLFSDDFFEKCGIDTDGDGEVFEYYNPEVALSRSAPSSSESDIVSDFLNQFDDSDPAFLDNVSFSESVPDWSLSIAGTKVSVFSFKLYAKYRSWIHTIISFIIWTCFLLGLYKSLPGLIGNVANTFDVSHDIFDDKTASK